ncbi:PH domain-containing protein [Candidatus Saccharibacteria bacterium]|nr:PH domain-containing protein [Candidatus Saccharibacteria bacterium]
MAEKYFADQFDDEEVLLVFRKHPIVMRRGFIAAMVMLLLGSVPALFNPTYTTYFVGMGVALVLAVLVMLPSWIGWYFSVFIVTDQRLIQITQKGLFNRSVIDMRLNQIQMVNYQIAGLQQTLLGFGTIMMQTIVGDLVIHEIHHPAKIQKKLLEILRDRGANVAAAPVAVPIDNSMQELQEDEAQD